ncbi:MAG TPA: RNA methyltransferase [Bryobacteraceae bacterium]|nr:RNA methyltransferase [Bryobacteraceae bacterium]
MEITGLRNPLLQKVRKAAAAGRPTEDGLVVAEGPHLLEEALRGCWRIVQIITTPAGRNKYADLLQHADAEIVEANARAFESIAGTEHSQQVLALLEPRVWNWNDLIGRRTFVLVLDGIQDPGNAGTIVRSAEAFGATGLVFLKGSAHVSNGKLLRASAGSIFRLPFLEAVSVSDFLSNIQSGLTLYVLDMHAQTTINDADLTRPLALAVGSEGSGVCPELLARAEAISIPTAHVESVNAAVACSVALFAAQQQRSTHEPV